jgi:antiviral helicase SLH1
MAFAEDIRMESILIFNEQFRPKMTEADVLAMLAMSTEFDQIQVRENEVPELKFMMDEIIPCQVKGGTDTSQGKVNILLQGYISRFFVEDFALVSDSMYSAQVRHGSPALAQFSGTACALR